MRLAVFAIITALACARGAAGQTLERFELGPVVRVDRVFLEGGAGGSTTVMGVVARFRFTRTLGVEAELTQAWSPIARSYEGFFISYVDSPNPTREEFERFAPFVRRTLGYDPGLGWSAAFVARGELTPRVTLGGRAGVSPRRYLETTDDLVLSIPVGVDPDRVARDFRSSSRTKTRGGFLVGVEVSVAVTDRFSIAPEFRFVYSGPARIGNKHRELGIGVRAGWLF